MLQEEGPKVRKKGREQWETVPVRVLVPGYFGCLGSTWNANQNTILDPPHPNAPTPPPTSCPPHRAHTISSIITNLLPIPPNLITSYVVAVGKRRAAAAGGKGRDKDRATESKAWGGSVGPIQGSVTKWRIEECEVLEIDVAMQKLSMNNGDGDGDGDGEKKIMWNRAKKIMMRGKRNNVNNMTSRGEMFKQKWEKVKQGQGQKEETEIDGWSKQGSYGGNCQKQLSLSTDSMQHLWQPESSLLAD
ncbi:unnamed protein product [Sphenostylis stenocarpa]|uniref:Uncharacterized protein n=1 Tax=Sphenostylis stenocarpa TaxID=92480 RepID=A0AA86VTK5_9FABA|nr:unnamed protein product [Sphenostylis stenocarpa]